MSAHPSPESTERSLPLGILDRIDQICDRFEGAWERGETPRIEDYLGAIDEPYRPALLHELLAAELDARRRRGERPTATEYADRCPDHAQRIRDLFPAVERGERLDRSGTDRRDRTEAGAEPAADGDRPQALRDYRIERELGRGGMGVVYRAFDQRRGEVVALKTVRRADAAAILRFKREFRALADLSHPNLVTLHELTADGSSWFYTMELIEGVDFRSFVRSETDPPLAETSEASGPPGTSGPGGASTVKDLIGDTGPSYPERVETGPAAGPEARLHLSPAALTRLRSALGQLAEGVEFLHEAGRLHRDLKPSNVLVTRHGRVVILDLGLTAELGPSGAHQSSEHQILGTASYMAPEQAAGRSLSPAVDWYSVGAMLYEVLTGRLPFVGRPLDILRDKQQFEPPAPCALVPGLPDDLNALCVDLLRRDPAARPTGREVLRRLGDGTGEPDLRVPAPPPHPLAPFVGRARQLECLEAAFADVCRGQTVACYIHGPSGVGKSALVRHFLDEQIGRDAATVLAGRCYEQESVPYKALDGIIDALGRYLKHLPMWEAHALLPRDIRSLIRVFPALRQAEAVAMAPRLAAVVPDPQELRRRAFRALRELLARLGDRRPLVLAIDDLQWGDSDSAVLLAELLRPPDAPRLLLLGCYRSDDAATSPLVRALLAVHEGDGSGVDRRMLGLGTLEPTEAEDLALRLLDREGEPVHARAVAIARESGGNPFFVAELVRSVQADAGLLDRGTGADEVDLDEVLWARIGRLPAEARRMLEVVAVSGRPIGPAEVSRAAELGERVHATLTLLRSGRLIRGAGSPERDEIETYHDRVREAVVAHLPPTILADHHRRLAQVLESSGRADPEVLAVHFQGAREPGRAGAYYAQAAAQAAEALAFDRAAKLYRLALELRPVDEAEARRLRLELAHALANAGRCPEAAREYLAAVAGATDAESLDCRRLAAMQFLISGHIDEGIAELGSVLEAVGMPRPTSLRRAILSLLVHRLRLRLRGLHYRLREVHQVKREDLARIDICWTAARGFGFIHPIPGADFSARHLLLALQAGEPHRITLGLCLEASHVAYGGKSSVRRASRLLRAAEEIAQRLDEPYAWGRVLLGQGAFTYIRGHWKRARELCDRADEVLRTRCTGVTWERDTANVFSLWSLQFQGELAELGRRWPALLKEAQDRGDRHVVTNLNTMLMSTLRLAADDPDGAEARLRQVMDQWSQQGYHIQHKEGHGAEVQIKLYRGDGGAAWRFVETRYGPSLARSLLMRIQKIRIFFFERRARCALAAAAEARDPDPLLKAAERDARRLQREGMPWSRALACPILAGMAATRGDRSRAAIHFAEAVTQLESVDMNLYAAASRRRLGEILGGEEGRAEVERADSWMKQQGIQNPARMADVFAAVVV